MNLLAILQCESERNEELAEKALEKPEVSGALIAIIEDLYNILPEATFVQVAYEDDGEPAKFWKIQVFTSADIKTALLSIEDVEFKHLHKLFDHNIHIDLLDY